MEDPDDDVEDEWRKFSQDPFEHMTVNEWKWCHKTVGYMFTGGDESDEEDGVRVDRYLEVGKGDMMFANSRRRREKACGEVSLDIDSILVFFTGFSNGSISGSFCFWIAIPRSWKLWIVSHGSLEKWILIRWNGNYLSPNK